MTNIVEFPQKPQDPNVLLAELRKKQKEIEVGLEDAKVRHESLLKDMDVCYKMGVIHGATVTLLVVIAGWVVCTLAAQI